MAYAAFGFAVGAFSGLLFSVGAILYALFHRSDR